MIFAPERVASARSAPVMAPVCSGVTSVAATQSISAAVAETEITSGLTIARNARASRSVAPIRFEGVTWGGASGGGDFAEASFPDGGLAPGGGPSGGTGVTCAGVAAGEAEGAAAAAPPARTNNAAVESRRSRREDVRDMVEPYPNSEDEASLPLPLMCVQLGRANGTAEWTSAGSAC